MQHPCFEESVVGFKTSVESGDGPENSTHERKLQEFLPDKSFIIIIFFFEEEEQQETKCTFRNKKLVANVILPKKET